MAISLRRYVDITSGVGAGASVATRELIGRFFTTNTLVPTDSVVEFTTLEDVGIYFGTDSDEYARATFYFGWISKNITRAQKIAFARWADSAVGSTIFGKVANYALGSFTGVSTGDFTLELGGFTHHITGIDLSGASNLSTVASDIQSAIRAYSAGGAAWTGATVVYNATRKSFDFVSGTTGDDTISVTAGSVTDVASLIGWLAGAILSNGSLAQSITTVLTESADGSNNFGSFTFMDTLTEDQIVEAAEWNLARNIQFMYSVRCTASNADDLADALGDIGGVCLTLSPLDNEYPEQVPMMILAATDYTQANAVQNYEFQIFNLTYSVSTDADADTYDDLRVNYYGQTQTAGQQIEFYQMGVMQGLAVDPRDQNTYANEIWFKDAAGAAIMTLLLALSRVSANSKGRSQLLAILQGVINQALLNGTISVAKPLTDTQKLYISEISNDPKAWRQVENLGYWIDVVITPYTDDGVVKYKAVYTLIYAKDDVIRKVEGRDILI